MKTIYLLLISILLTMLFLSCQEEEKSEILEEKLINTDILLKGDADRWLLDVQQLRGIFNFDNTLNNNQRNMFLNAFYDFLLSHGPYRRVVYEVLQAIKDNDNRKINVIINPNHSDFNTDSPYYALYDYVSYSMIFPRVNEAMNGILVVHELIHHWQNLVIGKRAFDYSCRRNIEFEVIFLMDVMLVKNQEIISIDSDLIQYFKIHRGQVAYTEAQKWEYLDAIRTTLCGQVYTIEAKLESFAENYKGYMHVGYTHNWGFAIIDRLLNVQSDNYIRR